jgi:hypothetical protein
MVGVKAIRAALFKGDGLIILVQDQAPGLIDQADGFVLQIVGRRVLSRLIRHGVIRYGWQVGQIVSQVGGA